MKGKVEPAPMLSNGIEHSLELTRHRHVTRREDGGTDALGERRHERLSLVVEIGDRELRARVSEMLCRPPGKAVLVGNADNQALAPLEINEFHGRFCVLSFLASQRTARCLRL